ncbi:hypothetical protein BRARA_B03216 [Brassica rapa]|uniref:TPX2 C-terminal domain-containing protein n=1 Tax=Brassica campestris TaxID=3711 RepID=A0A398AHT6_BRACM|nr:hypothetical protein BRARA_B03216 [Brassica rapa]
MGDSFCLARSFSQPADTSSHEVVPRGVLTESVSFGRFASETLQWAKWSAFTQNRYLEEVERFTKPGSVAEKKAFFEAHFKNRASGNTTKTKKTQEAKIAKTVCGAQKENLVDSEVPLVRHGEVGSVAPSISVTDATADVKIGEVKDTIAEKIDSMAVDEDEELDKENSASLSKERRPSSSMPVPEDEDLDKKNSTSLSKERGPSSSASKTYGRSSNPELDLPLKKPRKEPVSTKRNQSRSPPQPFHMSINCAPTDKAGKKMHQNGSRSSTKVKDALKADKKERSGPSSVHMPLNSATSTRQTTKTAPKRLARRSTTQETSSSNAGTSSKPKGTEPAVASKGRKRPLSRGAKEDSDVPKCSTTASAFGLPKLPPSPPNSRPLDEKRKNITGGSSVSSRIPNNVQRQPSASCDNVPTHSRTRAKSFTVSTPFILRSDERAEKRKEFFKKVEEKKKKEDAVKEQSSCGFKEHQEFKNPQVGGFQAPMISLTSPRVRRNQTPGRENIQKSRESPHKVASVKTTTTRNPSMEKYKRCKIHPSLTKKKTQEDSSPHVL